MKTFTRFRYISYLDLVCCGFGGALLLFLIMVATSSRRGPVNQMVVVRCYCEGGPKAEIGLLLKPPGSAQFLDPPRPGADPHIRSFSARSAALGGGEAFIVLIDPKSGEWEFLAYQKDFSGQGGVAAGQVRYEVIGQHLDRLADEVREGDGRLPGPGRFAGRITRVRIHPTLHGP